MLSGAFLQILNMSFTASSVIVMVLLARLTLKDAPKLFSYVLWSVVLFRLVCPFSFESGWSLFSVVPSQLAPSYTTSLHPELSQPVSSQLVPADASSSLIPRVKTGIAALDYTIKPIVAVVRDTASSPWQTWTAVGGMVWLAGMAVLILYSVISLVLLHRRLIGAVRLRDNIYLADHIATPFVMGVIRPKIFLPSTLTEQEQRYIIDHEQTHIRRFDPIVKIISFMVLTLHWFNPLVWAAFILCSRDMEMSCDEAVMKKMDVDIRAEYSASLLRLAAGRRIPVGAPLDFGEGDTKGRIRNVMKYKKPSFWVMAAASAAVIVLALCLLANPANPSSAAEQLVEMTPLEQLPDGYTLNDAKADGCVVHENGDITSGQSAWDAFVKATEAGKPAAVRLAFYYTLGDPSSYSPEYYRKYSAGYPALYIQDLSYDGESYRIRGIKNEEEVTDSPYKYMVKFTGKPDYRGAEYSRYTYYVLLNDKSATWKKIEQGMLSSRWGDYIDHRVVYSDLVYQ